MIGFPLEVTYTVRCVVCQRTSVEEFSGCSNLAMPIPSLPQGWSALNETIICDKHTIALSDPGHHEILRRGSMILPS